MVTRSKEPLAVAAKQLLFEDHARARLLQGVEKLADAVTAMLQGKEVAVPCLVDANREQLHVRKGKLQTLKASLKLQDYNAKRDFIAFGGDVVDLPQFKTIPLVRLVGIDQNETAVEFTDQ